MPHTSMINITFGEERRDAAMQRQKQSTSVASPQNRASRPVANGSSKQQQQPPVYKVLQHPRHLESSSPGQHVAARQSHVARPPQATAVSLQFCVIALLPFSENQPMTMMMMMMM